MCRILAFQSDQPVALGPWIASFAQACRASREYQGHGWGVAWWEDEGWRRYRTTTPIWEDEIPSAASRLAVVHARSAFRDEGIVVENNMPFVSDDLAFAFNGELHGVRLSVPGATGAARLHHLLQRFHVSAEGDLLTALERLDEVVRRRSEYVRALNLVVSDGRSLVVSTRFGEDPGYFTMHQAHGFVSDSVRGTSQLRVVASEPIPIASGNGDLGLESLEWAPVPNGSTFRLGEEVACSS